MNHNERITYFGQTDSRGKKVKFGIKARDRTKHMYVIGKTGMGKSTLLENMAIQDIQNGEGLAFIDPHGGTAEKLLEYIPEERIHDVLYFAPFDLEYPISFNVMENVDADKRHLVANGLMSVFEKIWEDMWSARMAYILNNTILALLEYPGATLLGINRMLADKQYRKKVVENITDPSVKAFWTEEFAGYSDRYAQEATPAIQNKIGQFTSNALMRNIIGQSKSSFDIRDIMDTRKILIINLSKGRMGEGNASLLGSMLITKIYLAAMSRADVSASASESLPNFYLYVDEFQSFANRSFADILSEARKYKLNLTIAHQYVEQMSEEVRAAVFGNVGTMITFRVGAIDAEVFEKEYMPTFTGEDLVNLGVFQMYLKLMINGVSSHPFSAVSLPPIKPIHASVKEDAITFSREHYGNPRTLVEEKIRQWHEPIVPSSKSKTQPNAQQQTDSNKNEKAMNKSYLPPLTELQIKQLEELSKSSAVDTKTILSNTGQQNGRPIKQNYSVPPMPTSGSNKSEQKHLSLRELKNQSVYLEKTKKEPTKENRLELQKALASVMKDREPVKQPLEISEEENRSNDGNEKTVGGRQKNILSINEEDSSVKTNDSKMEEPYNLNSQKTPEKKEVPEEVLLKILDLKS